jgi:hypothetical protein
MFLKEVAGFLFGVMWLAWDRVLGLLLVLRLLGVAREL